MESTINNKMQIKHELRHEQLLATIGQAASMLLGVSTVDEATKELMSIMEKIGNIMDAHQVHIWRVFDEQGVQKYTHAYNWIDASIEIEKPLPTGIVSPAGSIDEWERSFASDEHIAGKVLEMPELERDYLSSFGVKSFLIIPILLGDNLWGTVQIDDCVAERDFDLCDIPYLRSIGYIMANAINRYQLIIDLNDTASWLEDMLEEAQIANRIKSDFMSRMSHEMKTPMNAIIGISQVLKMYNLPDEVIKYISEIESNSKHLMSLISGVLDFSDINEGKFRLSNSEFDFHMMIEKIINAFKEKAEVNRQTFTSNVDSSVPKMVVGDEIHLERVITSILSNAIKFTPDGGEIYFESLMIGNHKGVITLQFKISDTGRGMSKQEQERLFDMFEQADGGLSRRFEGVGLGLPLSKRLVEKMGGDIEVKSQVGKGATFMFTCKLREPAQSDCFKNGAPDSVVKESGFTIW